VGTTYPRRAKQLIKNGRAAWLEEGQTLQLSPTPAVIKEDTLMVDGIGYSTNNSKVITETTEVPVTDSDELLMYKARQNVRNKKNLIKHFFAFIAAWPILAIVYGTLVQNASHPQAWRIQDTMRTIDSLAPHIPEDYWWVIDNMAWFLNGVIRNYVPSIWYVILGVMLAWGTWIALRVAKQILIKLNTKKAKQDPIMQEYERLKNMDSVDLR